MGILFFGAMFGFQEAKDFWTYDIGTCIAAIGVVWTIGSFFRFYPTLAHNYASLVVAITTFILGFAINEYGVFTGCILVGIATIYFAYISHPLAPIQATTMFLIAIPLIVLGLALRPFDMPTSPTKYYHPITRNDIKWGAFLYLINDEQGTNLAYIVGTEETAYKETRRIVTEWKSNNPSLRIREVQVRINDSLYDDAKAEGYLPTHALFKLGEFPVNRIPKYCNLTDLEN
jgi:hypothetical protein